MVLLQRTNTSILNREQVRSVKLCFVSDKNASSGWLECPALTRCNDEVREVNELGEGGRGEHELVSDYVLDILIILNITIVLVIIILLVVTLNYTIWCHFCEGHCSPTAPQRHIYTRNCSDEPVNIVIIINILTEIVMKNIIVIIICVRTQPIQTPSLYVWPLTNAARIVNTS